MCAAMFESDCGCIPHDESPAGCEASKLQTLRSTQLEAIAAGDTFDLACADAHIENIEQLDCQPFGEYIASGANPACQIYSGSKQIGESCTPHFDAITLSLGPWMSDCAQGLWCAVDRCVEAVTTFPPAESGGPCLDLETYITLGLCPAEEVCNQATGLCGTSAAECSTGACRFTAGSGSGCFDPGPSAVACHPDSL